ncbi:MAG: M48 family metallopeptidase [Verrucomicrobiales bacterium]|nr:M48 family metallopeptidase [Verrucomicrobiales bacterium]
MSTTKEVNPYTGEEMRIALTPQQEVQMGLAGAPQMAAQHGGLHANKQAQDLIDRVGQKLVAHTPKLLPPDRQGINYPFEFHLLADERTVNAFALPGGQIFITAALAGKLTEDQLAGVLGHEVGHVLAKHSNQQMAKQGLLSGVGQAVAVMVGGESGVGGHSAGAMVTQVLSTRYGREDELESDRIGAILMHEAGYDPRELINVMKILAESSGGGGGPEFMSTHPHPESRIEQLKNVVLPKLGY